MPFETLPAPEAVPADRIASNAIRKHGTKLLDFLIGWIAEGIRILWENEDATPEEICADLGADAEKAFTGHYAAVQLAVVLWALASRAGDPAVKLPPNAFQLNGQTGELAVDRNAPYVP